MVKMLDDKGCPFGKKNVDVVVFQIYIYFWNEFQKENLPKLELINLVRHSAQVMRHCAQVFDA